MRQLQFSRCELTLLHHPGESRGLSASFSCPYGVIFWNEDKQVAQKCTLCAHLLDEGWKEPRCGQACPTGALSIHRLNDTRMQELIEKEKLEANSGKYRLEIVFKNSPKQTIEGELDKNRNEGIILIP